ncbi:MAG: hypothetical protein HC877_05880 [Thioploca sp.]|nr:hypothetical protein [Thioploca sp.]
MHFHTGAWKCAFLHTDRQNFPPTALDKIDWILFNTRSASSSELTSIIRLW